MKKPYKKPILVLFCLFSIVNQFIVIWGLNQYGSISCSLGHDVQFLVIIMILCLLNKPLPTPFIHATDVNVGDSYMRQNNRFDHEMLVVISLDSYFTLYLYLSYFTLYICFSFYFLSNIIML